MKQVFFMGLMCLVLLSCSIRNPVIQTTSSLDYSDYTRKGFFITESNSVNFEYQPISSVEASFISGFEVVVENGVPVYIEGPYGKFLKTTKKYIIATHGGLLEQFYKKATELGANGVINFKFHTISTPNKYGSSITGYQATGMAIKK